MSRGLITYEDTLEIKTNEIAVMLKVFEMGVFIFWDQGRIVTIFTVFTLES